MNSRRVRVTVRGRVQGVGFRYATCEMARDIGVRGWVRNLPGGEVEAEFHGSNTEVEAALAWCQHGPRLAHVTAVETTWLEDGPADEAFAIRR